MKRWYNGFIGGFGLRKDTAMIILLTFNGLFNIRAETLDTTVAYINGQSVEIAELRREMLRHRSNVYSGYAKIFDLSQVHNFWYADLEGTKPMDSLRNRALKALVEIKVQQKLLEEKKLWPYNNYRDFQIAWREENEYRVNQVQQKGVIYGPVVYTEQVFFDYKFSNALITLKNVLTGHIIPLNDNVLAAHFEVLKKDGVYSDEKIFNDFKRQVKDSYIEKEYKDLVMKMVNEAKVKTVIGYNMVGM